MPVPGFTAEISIGPTLEPYRANMFQGYAEANGLYPQQMDSVDTDEADIAADSDAESDHVDDEMEDTVSDGVEEM